MKTFQCNIIIAALVVDTASSFIASSCAGNNRSSHKSDHPRVGLATDDNYQATSTGAEFPSDESAIQSAYEEWRLLYGKGAFDPVRYENFKNNFEKLTVANLEARNKAFAEARPAPQWMTLNEYGDFSAIEYEAVVQGGQVPTPLAPSQIPKPEKTIEQIDTKVPIAMQENESLKTELAMGIMGEYQDQFGRTIRSTEVISPAGRPRKTTLIEDAQPPTSPRQTFVIPEVGTSAATVQGTQVVNKVDQPLQQGTQIIREPDRPFAEGTQVIRKDGQTQTQGTQVIKKSDQYASVPSESPQTNGRSTIVIDKVLAEAMKERIADETREYQDQFGRTIRSTNVVSQASRPRKTTLIEDAQPPTSPRQTFVIPEGGTSAAPVQGTQVVNEVDQPIQQGTQVVKKIEQPTQGTQVSRKSDRPLAEGTQVIRKDDQTQSQGTQVVKKIDQYVSAPSEVPQAEGRSTIVVDKESAEVMKASITNEGLQDDNVAQGTRVIARNDESSAEGTRVVKSESEASVQGTMVLKERVDDTFQGTRVIKSKDEDIVQGTGAVKRQDDASDGTIVVKPSNNDIAKKTKVIKRDDLIAEDTRGTFIIKKAQPKKLFSFPFFGFGDKNDDERSEARPTLVVKRRISKPKKTQEPFSLDFFRSPEKKNDFVDRSDVAVQIEADLESSSLFSFFGGVKKASNPSRSVRGTINLQKRGVSVPGPETGASARKTVLVDKSELGETVPSLFTFFGGAKKKETEEASGRPTITIGKPKRGWTSPFSTIGSPSSLSTTESTYTVAQQEVDPKVCRRLINSPDRLPFIAHFFQLKAAARAAQLERQRLRTSAMKQRREAMEIQKENTRKELRRKWFEITEARKQRAGGFASKEITTKPEAPTEKKIFSFLGPKEIPEVKRWKQNRDGSIIGLIYNSRNFKDGTRVTTSPVPRGAKRGSVVKTGSGNQYRLS